MLLKSRILKYILDIILVDDHYTGIEIKSNGVIAANYGDNYYISYYVSSDKCGVCEDCVEWNKIDKDYILPLESVKKLYKLISLWPDGYINIRMKHNGFVSIENASCPVLVECLFTKSCKDYTMEPPNITHNCTINSIGLSRIFDFCHDSDSVSLEINDKTLIISSDNYSMSIELEDVMEVPHGEIILGRDTLNLIYLFLRKLLPINDLLYLLFIEQGTAFSIKAMINDCNYVQIYTVHE